MWGNIKVCWLGEIIDVGKIEQRAWRESEEEMRDGVVDIWKLMRIEINTHIQMQDNLETYNTDS